MPLVVFTVCFVGGEKLNEPMISQSTFHYPIKIDKLKTPIKMENISYFSLNILHKFRMVSIFRIWQK